MGKLDDLLNDVAEALKEKPLLPNTPVEIPLHQNTGMGLVSAQPVLLAVEVRAGVRRARAILDETGYGSWVSDAQLEHLVVKILIDAAKARASA